MGVQIPPAPPIHHLKTSMDVFFCAWNPVKNKSVPNGTYLTFFGCPFLLTSALAAERVCISIG